MRPTPEPAAPGQESVWAYPRPPIAEPVPQRLRIVQGETVVADTLKGVRTLETSHPPTYYFPMEDVNTELLRQNPQRSFCEWKGSAVYFDLVWKDKVFEAVAWSYPSPSATFACLANHVAFYAAPFDACTVDDEKVKPQPGGFYGGWITSRQAGPFKGTPGSRFW